jgi:hypothetical protein
MDAINKHQKGDLCSKIKGKKNTEDGKSYELPVSLRGVRRGRLGKIGMKRQQSPRQAQGAQMSLLPSSLVW